MIKIAITGGAGSGKSTVTRMFQELGAEVLDADAVARDVAAPGQPAGEELRRVYGPDFFQEDGSLDRSRMARLVFENPEERRRLDGIVHPRIAQEIKARLQELEHRGVPLVLVEVPLLFEAGLADAYDRIIVVAVDWADQVQRLRDRDHRGEEEIAGILQAQWPLRDKAARAHYVVDNRGSRAHTLAQVKKIWGELQKIIKKSS